MTASETYSPTEAPKEQKQLLKMSSSEKDNVVGLSIIHGKDRSPTMEKFNSEEKKKKCQTRLKILWSFISFLISILDVTVIIYVSYLHFHHSSDIIAWLMLIPILLNFIGIFTFLSDDEERKEMEQLGCQRKTWKNLMFFPIIGPTVSAMRLFGLSLRENKEEDFERLESLLTRMKQYESFFRAAPEAFVQITFRIITWSHDKKFHYEDYWTNVCLLLCLFTLAESNMYGPVLPYYRLFHRIKTKDAWKIDHISIPWRVALFLFSYLSIGSRIYADAILKATSCFYFHEFSFGEVLIVTFLCQFVVRAGFYYLFNSFIFGSKRRQKQVADEGVYGAFTYSWRSLFMAFDFQSYCLATFFWFYIENTILIVGSYTVIYTMTDVDLSDKYIFHVYAIFAFIGMFTAISLKFGLRNKWKRSQSNKVVASA